MVATIRPAVAADVDAVMGLLRELDESHVELEPTLLRAFTAQPRPNEWLLARFADPQEACFVAELEGKVIGFVWSKSQNAPQIPAFIQEPLQIVGDLVVHSSARRRGVGRALLERALDWGRARGIRQVQLTVFARNEAANRFYDQMGFRKLSYVMLKPL